MSKKDTERKNRVPVDYDKIADEIIGVLMKREVLVCDVPVVLKLVTTRTERSLICPVADLWDS